VSFGDESVLDPIHRIISHIISPINTTQQAMSKMSNQEPVATGQYARRVIAVPLLPELGLQVLHCSNARADMLPRSVRPTTTRLRRCGADEPTQPLMN
jgi:hypothetical protein